MRYVLKNKDKRVLEFEVEKDSEIFEGKTIDYISLKDASIVDENLLPKQISPSHLLRSLESFIKHRKVPQNRQFANNILATIPTNEKNNPMAYIDISFGLSLNDSYWIVPEGKDYQWKDFNLYNNEFSEALALSAFGLNLTKVKGFTSSPEYTTNGMLKKCWHRDNGQIYLYKGSTEEYANGGKEAFSEYYMAQIAEVMEFDYVPYDLKKFHNQIVSSCPIFTNENEGYTPIHYLLREPPKNYDKLKLMVEISNIYGKESFRDLMLFDALICNIDRHLGNFGMIVDNNTNEILRPAPIFDNGLSFIATLDRNQLNSDIEKCLARDISYFDFSFDEQLELFAQVRHIPNLEKLSNFTFERHKEFNLGEEWLQSIEQYIRVRAKKAIQFIEEKQKSAIQRTADTTKDNQTNFDTDNFNTLSPTEKLAQLQANQEAISNLPKAREFLKEDSTNLENLQEDKKEFQDSTLQQTKNKK